MIHIDILLSTTCSIFYHTCICPQLLCAVLWTFSTVCDLCYRPQLATRLLAHKIQSPQEWEAMQALLVSLDLNQDLYLAASVVISLQFFLYSNFLPH